MNEKISLLIYYDYENMLEILSGEETKKLLLAMIQYDKHGILPDFDGQLKMAFAAIKINLDRDKDKWIKTRNQKIEAGRKGGNAKSKIERSQAPLSTA